MFYSSIYAGDNYNMYPEAVRRGLAYLKEHDLAAMEPGTYEIEGKKLYVQNLYTMKKQMEESHLEMHYKYIDLQFIIEGREIMGFAPKISEPRIIEPIESRDLYYVEDVDNEQFIEVKAGEFAVFFPNDLHRADIVVPGDDPGPYHKAVVKISMDLI